MQKLKALLACLTLAPGVCYGLGLGELELRSGLNDRLDARIPLVSVEPGELEDLRARLAGLSDFERAGLARPHLLTRLRFDIVHESKESYIHVTSKEHIEEPYLNFIVELNGPDGRILREYTVLFDI